MGSLQYIATANNLTIGTLGYCLTDLFPCSAKLVSWSLTSPFSTNMAISKTKGQGWRAIPTQWKKASDILTSTLAAFLFSIYPKRERDRVAHLNYYASTDNKGRELPHCKTKLNQMQQNTRINLNWAIQVTQNEHNKLNPGSVISYDLQPGNGVGLFW